MEKSVRFLNWCCENFRYNSREKRWEKITINRDDTNDSVDVYTPEELFTLFEFIYENQLQK